MVSVQTTGPIFRPGNPTKVFDTRYYVGGYPYDVSPDGQRFLMIKNGGPSEQATTGAPASMIVVLNWTEELKQRVPRRARETS